MRVARTARAKTLADKEAGGAGVVAGVAAGAAGVAAGADCAGGAGVGVAAAGGFEPSQAIKAVTPKERQMIGTIFMEMGVLTESFGIKVTSLRVYLTIPSGSSPIP